jgi:hypothetical protein
VERSDRIIRTIGINAGEAAERAEPAAISARQISFFEDSVAVWSGATGVKT